ncbi:MAG: hypothetical protein Ct9H300mP1_18620 [Planctomycetaceae bacterium]|nr:MAG: hypothetical protein Ct9H300mP1_18620 [Planctomycetaceae bacterium]
MKLTIFGFPLVLVAIGVSSTQAGLFDFDLAGKLGLRQEPSRPIVVRRQPKWVTANPGSDVVKSSSSRVFRLCTTTRERWPSPCPGFQGVCQAGQADCRV